MIDFAPKPRANDAAREMLGRQVEQFKAAGGTIEEVPVIKQDAKSLSETRRRKTSMGRPIDELAKQAQKLADAGWYKSSAARELRMDYRVFEAMLAEYKIAFRSRR